MINALPLAMRGGSWPPSTGGKVPYWRLRYVRKSIEKNAKEAP
jgi:hypothetical protein